MATSAGWGVVAKANRPQPNERATKMTLKSGEEVYQAAKALATREGFAWQELTKNQRVRFTEQVQELANAGQPLMRVRVHFVGVHATGEQVRHWWGPASRDRFELLATLINATTTHLGESTASVEHTELISAELVRVNEDGSEFVSDKPKGTWF